VIEITTFLLAEAAYVSENRFYIHGGGFADITAPSLPYAIPQIAIVIRVTALLRELEVNPVVQLDFLGPDGNTIVGQPANVPLPPVPQSLTDSETASLQLVVTFSPLPVTQSGVHRVTASIKGTPVAEESFLVRQA
jgi:hypothetical protein